jgi:cytoskeletal protein RodZ
MITEVNRRVGRRRQLTALLAAIALGTAGLAGCGSSGSGNGSTAKTTSSTSVAAASASKAALEARRAALRRASERDKASSASHSHPGTGTAATGRPGSGSSTAAAGRTGAGSTAATSAAAHRATEQLRKAFAVYVSCLKSHGINVPASTTKSGLLTLKGVNTSTPRYRAAAKACEKTVMNALGHSR